MKKIITITLLLAFAAIFSCKKDSVKQVFATGVSLNKTNAVLLIDDTEELVATVIPKNAVDQTVSWQSSDPTVATVDNGRVRALAAGTVSISVTVVSGGYTAGCIITVKSNEIPATGISLNKTVLIKTVGDAPETLIATVEPAEASNSKILWTTGDASIATVSESGRVTFAGAGETTITAATEDGKFSAECKISVQITDGDVTSTGWSNPNTANYEHSMTYVSQIAFQGVLSENPAVELAAFVGNECRGVAKLVYEPALQKHLVHLTVYGNTGAETVKLRAYNPAKKRIYENCAEFKFQSNTGLGGVSEVLNCKP